MSIIITVAFLRDGIIYTIDSNGYNNGDYKCLEEIFW